MTPQSPGSPEAAAREYEFWVSSCDALGGALDQLRDEVVSALPDDAAKPLLSRIESIEGLMAKADEHAEAAFKALAAALLSHKGVR